MPTHYFIETTNKERISDLHRQRAQTRLAEQALATDADEAEPKPRRFWLSRLQFLAVSLRQIAQPKSVRRTS